MAVNQPSSSVGDGCVDVSGGKSGAAILQCSGVARRQWRAVPVDGAGLNEWEKGAGGAGLVRAGPAEGRGGDGAGLGPAGHDVDPGAEASCRGVGEGSGQRVARDLDRVEGGATVAVWEGRRRGWQVRGTWW